MPCAISTLLYLVRSSASPVYFLYHQPNFKASTFIPVSCKLHSQLAREYKFLSHSLRSLRLQSSRRLEQAKSTTGKVSQCHGDCFKPSLKLMAHLAKFQCSGTCFPQESRSKSTQASMSHQLDIQTSFCLVSFHSYKLQYFEVVPAFSRRLDQKSTKGPFQPKLCCDSVPQFPGFFQGIKSAEYL